MIEYYKIPEGRIAKIRVENSDDTLFPKELYVSLVDTVENLIARSIKVVEDTGEDLYKVIVTYRGTNLKESNVISVTGLPCDASVYVNEKANDDTALIKLEPDIIL